MRLDRIYIDGFGRFHDLTIDHIPSGLSVFYGNNEAGKSTLLAFIRAILFGFTDGRSRHDSTYPPLRGGRQGGLIAVIDSAGNNYTVERRPGSRGGLVTVTLPDGQMADGGVLTRLLGNATRDLYRNVFAFSLAELQQFESLDDDAVKSTIYSAGMGMGLVSLPAVEGAWDKVMDETFKRGGTRSAINRIWSELDELRAKVQSKTGIREEYDKANQKRADLESEIDMLERRRRAARKWESTAQRFIKIWGDWNALSLAEQELCGLLGIGLDQVEVSVDESKASAWLSQAGWKAMSAEQSSEIEDLSRRGERYKATLPELPKLKSELQTARSEFRQSLSELGFDWDAKRVQATDTSVAVRDRIYAHREAIQKHKEQFRESRASLQASAEAARQACAEMKGHRSAPNAQQPALQAILGRFASPLPFWPAAAIIILALGLGTIAALYLRNDTSPLALLGSLILGAMLSTLYLVLNSVGQERHKRWAAARDAFDQAEARHSKAIQELAEARTAWTTWLSSVGLPTDLSPEGALEMFASIRASRERANTLSRLKDIVSEKRKFVAQYRKQVISLAGACKPPFDSRGEASLIIDRLVRRLDLERDIKRLNSALEELAGRDDRLAAFKKALGKSSPVKQEAWLNRAGEMLSSLDQKLREKHKELGSVEERLKQLEEEDILGLLIEEQSLLASLADHARKWSVYAMAKAILREARERYERERQPEVIKDASQFFAQITAGEYRQILASPEQSTLHVVDKHDRPKQMDVLSRGTKEQLYYAVRLGLIREFNRRQEPLPVMVDDIFVNFDPHRAEAALHALLTLTATNQVLLFTCHPETCDLVHQIAPETPMFTLPEGQRAHFTVAG